MKRYAIIVAGGSGKRMKSTVPKQFLLLKGKPVLMHTVQRFIDFDPAIKIILALPQAHFSFWNSLCKKYKFNFPHKVVAGGAQRFFSVKNALAEVNPESIIGVHDGVRPLVSQDTIKKCYKTAQAKGNSIPVIDIAESMRKKKDGYGIVVDRNEYVIVQTPQCFTYEILKKAYSQKYKNEFTDDASVIEKTGIKINLVEGNRENIKITTPSDLIMAECLMKQ